MVLGESNGYSIQKNKNSKNMTCISFQLVPRHGLPFSGIYTLHAGLKMDFESPDHT